VTVPLLIKDNESNDLGWRRRVRDLLNMVARRTLDSGVTADRPVNPTDGQTFYDDSLKRRVDYNAADAKWYGGEGPSNLVTTAIDYTMLVTDGAIICNKASTLTLTLLAAASYPGRELMVKTLTANTVVSATSNVAPIASATAGTAILPATAGAWARLKSDGTNWIVMSRGT
jgi:hypothetical protein